MGRGLWAGLVALALLTACSGGGGSAANTTATTSTTTSTTAATTSTTSPEDAVKTAYLDYWKMIDRLAEAPNGDDPELPMRTVDPRLSAAREAFTTAAIKGETTKTPSNGLYKHIVKSVQVSGSSAVVTDCTVDDQVVFDHNGQPVDDAVTTKHYQTTLVLVDATWRVSELKVADRQQGVQSCDA